MRKAKMKITILLGIWFISLGRGSLSYTQELAQTNKNSVGSSLEKIVFKISPEYPKNPPGIIQIRHPQGILWPAYYLAKAKTLWEIQSLPKEEWSFSNGVEIESISLSMGKGDQSRRIIGHLVITKEEQNPKTEKMEWANELPTVQWIIQQVGSVKVSSVNSTKSSPSKKRGDDVVWSLPVEGKIIIGSKTFPYQSLASLRINRDKEGNPLHLHFSLLVLLSAREFGLSTTDPEEKVECSLSLRIPHG